MKSISVLTPAATLLCAMMMMLLNISIYKSENWIWTNVLLSVGILFTLIAYVFFILKNNQAFWIQLLGTLFSLICIIPLFFKTFFALINGDKSFLFSFITMLIILTIQAILSMISYKNIANHKE